MNLEEAIVVAAEDEGEGVERQVAPKPHIFRRMHGHLWPEELTVCSSNQAIDAVRADDQVGALELREVAHLALKLQPNSERPAAPLQDVEQNLARDPGKDVAAGPDHGVAVIDVDRVPASEALADLGVGFVVGIPKRTKRLFREDDTPTERGVGWITLHHEDLVSRVGLLG